MDKLNAFTNGQTTLKPLDNMDDVNKRKLVHEQSIACLTKNKE